MIMSVGVDPWNAGLYRAADEDIVDIRVDGEALDYTDTYIAGNLEYFGLRRWKEFVTGRVKADTRNENSKLTANYRAVG